MATLRIAWLLTIVFAGNLWAKELPPEWPVADPAQHGFSEARLEGAWRVLALNNSTTFLVIHSDHVVFERYASGFDRNTPHYTASLAKALIGGLSLMVAMADGRIDPEDPASKYVPAWRNDPEKSAITVAQLATHTSGLEDANEPGVPHRKLKGWKGEFWKMLGPPRDPFTLARDHVPLAAPPGTRALYSNPGTAMLGYCVTASLRDGPHREIKSLLRDRLFRNIGIPDEEWSAGYNGPIEVDGLELIGNWGGATFSPSAAARVGRLLLRRGDWDEVQLLPAGVVAEALRHAGLPNHSGLSWWINQQPDGSRVLSQAPEDTFWGLGAGGQILLVVPSLDLIVVRNGSSLPPGTNSLRMMEKLVINPVLDARLKSATPPYPPSAFISRIEWAPRESIVRLAPGSDNWPTTWADDDAIYAAYGDGNGFEPFVPEKLSLGLARVTGIPPDVSGANIRSATAEQTGDGRRGRKASGLLMVDGTLYLLARNAQNAQLAWSADHGRSWEWSSWTFRESFGCPAFINFGRNYANARDDHVYVVSPDTHTAYERADRLVLARVPKHRLRDRGAYEFFAGFDDRSGPRWSADISARSGIFEHAGSCYRSHITYHPGLRRYLLTVIGRGTDTRYAGGFAVYDAAEPWGPWTTAFFADTWDVGPGESNHFPAKWLQPDGREGWLVFSGDDSFSLRQATFITEPNRAGD